MRTGPSERQTIAECQAGFVYPNGSRTGSFCKKPDLCRSEGQCHFVAQAERHMERLSRPPGIRWVPGFDEREVA
jgi:hypothetical protein